MKDYVVNGIETEYPEEYGEVINGIIEITDIPDSLTNQIIEIIIDNEGNNIEKIKKFINENMEIKNIKNSIRNKVEDYGLGPRQSEILEEVCTATIQTTLEEQGISKDNAEKIKNNLKYKEGKIKIDDLINQVFMIIKENNIEINNEGYISNILGETIRIEAIKLVITYLKTEIYEILKQLNLENDGKEKIKELIIKIMLFEGYTKQLQIETNKRELINTFIDRNGNFNFEHEEMGGYLMTGQGIFENTGYSNCTHKGKEIRPNILKECNDEIIRASVEELLMENKINRERRSNLIEIKKYFETNYEENEEDIIEHIKIFTEKEGIDEKIYKELIKKYEPDPLRNKKIGGESKLKLANYEIDPIKYVKVLEEKLYETINKYKEIRIKTTTNERDYETEEQMIKEIIVCISLIAQFERINKDNSTMEKKEEERFFETIDAIVIDEEFETTIEKIEKDIQDKTTEDSKKKEVLEIIETNSKRLGKTNRKDYYRELMMRRIFSIQKINFDKIEKELINRIDDLLNKYTNEGGKEKLKNIIIYTIIKNEIEKRNKVSVLKQKRLLKMQNSKDK